MKKILNPSDVEIGDVIIFKEKINYPDPYMRFKGLAKYRENTVYVVSKSQNRITGEVISSKGDDPKKEGEKIHISEDMKTFLGLYHIEF